MLLCRTRAAGLGLRALAIPTLVLVQAGHVISHPRAAQSKQGCMGSSGHGRSCRRAQACRTEQTGVHGEPRTREELPQGTGMQDVGVSRGECCRGIRMGRWWFVCSAAAPMGAPLESPGALCNSTIWQAGSGMLWGCGTGIEVPGSAGGPNLGSSSPRSCTCVPSRIGSGHPVPAANPVLVVQQPPCPTWHKVCKVSENTPNMFPHSLPQAPQPWEKENRFSCNPQRLKGRLRMLRATLGFAR